MDWKCVDYCKICCSERELQFYELSSFEPYCHISGLESVPLKLHFWSDPKNHNYCLLSFGDGEVSIDYHAYTMKTIYVSMIKLVLCLSLPVSSTCLLFVGRITQKCVDGFGEIWWGDKTLLEEQLIGLGMNPNEGPLLRGRLLCLEPLTRKVKWLLIWLLHTHTISLHLLING